LSIYWRDSTFVGRSCPGCPPTAPATAPDDLDAAIAYMGQGFKRFLAGDPVEVRARSREDVKDLSVLVDITPDSLSHQRPTSDVVALLARRERFS